MQTPLTSKTKICTRRKFLKKAVVGIASATAATQAPYGYAARRFELRVLGTHVTLQEPLRLQAEKDLGIKITFEPGGSASILHKASTRPQSFDLYEQWSNSIRVLWRADAIQPIEVERIRYWDEVNGLTKVGRILPTANLGAGDSPNKLIFVQDTMKLASTPTNKISFLPYVHNVDSFGYNTQSIPLGKPYETESWGWMLDPDWVGKVAFVNDPTIGLFDLALAVQAKGWMEFKDLGNITREEIDQLFSLLIPLKQRGHFRGAWSSVPESVDMMCNREVVIESMFSPGVAAINGAGVPCTYAAPREGYRAWHGVMCLSSHTHGMVKDAAYEYMNWWLSGWPGAFIARQGYYISNPQRSRDYLSDAEWAYWYRGEPASSDLKNTFGEVSVKRGSVRTGGSYERRFSNIAVWNTVMNTYEYSLPRWKELLLA